jgi:hypothetical protein
VIEAPPPVKLPGCRGCAVMDVYEPGTHTLLGSPACQAHYERWKDLQPGRREVPLPNMFCKRCSEPVMHDRVRMRRELALYGVLTGVCPACFVTRAADSYMPPRKV